MDEVKGLRIIHLNVRSLVRKIDLLRVLVDSNMPDIITLSETWLNSSVSDSEINLANYDLYRYDRCSRGGGVAIYVSIGLVSELVIPSVDPLYCECIFVKVILHLNKCLTIGSIYRPPSPPIKSFNSLIATINSIFGKNFIILLGDFNY